MDNVPVSSSSGSASQATSPNDVGTPTARCGVTIMPLVRAPNWTRTSNSWSVTLNRFKLTGSCSPGTTLRVMRSGFAAWAGSCSSTLRFSHSVPSKATRLVPWPRAVAWRITPAIASARLACETSAADFFRVTCTPATPLPGKESCNEADRFGFRFQRGRFRAEAPWRKVEAPDLLRPPRCGAQPARASTSARSLANG